MFIRNERRKYRGKKMPRPKGFHGGVSMPKSERTESQKIGDELAEEKETYGLYDKANSIVGNRR
jgi:hypothetical protein